MSEYFSYAVWGVSVLIVGALIVRSNCVVYIPNEKIGIVEKNWSLSGSLQQGFIALAGEAGFQPAVLRGGFHFFFPYQYTIHRADLVTIEQGTLAYIFARDGQAMPPTQNLACNKTANDFTDVAAFLQHGGQKGLQRKILREGTYAINLAQFIVLGAARVYALPLPGDANINPHGEAQGKLAQMLTELVERNGFSPLVIRDDKLAVITTHEGQSLPEGTIVAPVIGADPADGAVYHHDFQNPEVFIDAGGYKGRQLQVLVEGTYYLNARFATYEIVAKRVVEVGFVGVVVSYTGKAGIDVSGDDYRHGELVKSDEKGVLSEPLLPGKYALNPYAKRVIDVPTTNFILKWQSGAIGSHQLDKGLSEVSLITKDAFEPNLPLSVVVNIDYKKAPLVIQRFGNIQMLVEQTLDPMVAAYFKNIGQGKTLIELLQQRSEIQQMAKDEMARNFANYSLTLNEVLIGTPCAKDGDVQIEVILKQLRERQVSREQLETYRTKEAAAMQERQLREAETRAAQQTGITQSELAVLIATNTGNASIARATKAAEEARQSAMGQADATKTLADAEAYRISRTGEAEAAATKLNVDAYGGAELQLQKTVLLRFAEAIEKGHIQMVPTVQSGGAGQHSAVDAFLGLMSRELVSKLPKADLVL